MESFGRGQFLPGAADLALLASRLPVRARVPAIAMWRGEPVLGLDSVSSPPGVNPLTWPPAFFSWFAAGMLLAEWVYHPMVGRIDWRGTAF